MPVLSSAVAVRLSATTTLPAGQWRPRTLAPLGALTRIRAGSDSSPRCPRAGGDQALQFAVDGGLRRLRRDDQVGQPGQLLLLGGREAARPPLRVHPMLYGRELQTDYAEHLIEPFVPEREVVATAASAAAPLSAYGAKARDVTDALAAIAARVLPPA
jgi:hypothetical protein